MAISTDPKVKKRRRIALWIALCSFVLAFLFYYFDCHWILVGYFKNQPWYRGLPAQYWRARIVEYIDLVQHSQDILPSSKIQVLIWLNQDPYSRPIPDGEEETLPLLLFLLKDEDPRVREFAVRMLGTIKPVSSHVIEVLIDTLDDDDVMVRLYCLGSLAQHGSDARAAFPKVMELLKDRDLKREACGALHAIDPQEAQRRNIPTMLDP